MLHTEEQSPSNNLPAMLFLTKPRMLLACFATRAYSWLMVSLLFTSTSRSISARLLSTCVCWCLALFLPRCRTVHLPFSIHVKLLVAQVSLTGSTTNPPHFESSAMLLRVDLCIFTNTSHDFKSRPLSCFFLFVLLV